MNAIPSHICLTLNDTEVPYSNNVKYLGVHHIDPQLNFQAHIRATEQRSRISISIGIISKLKYFLPTSPPSYTLLCFCSPPPTQWTYHLGSHSSKLSKKSFCTSKQSRLAPQKGAYRDHITPFYSAPKILKLHDLFKH